MRTPYLFHGPLRSVGVLAFLLAGAWAWAWAQSTPGLINFQGRLTDNLNNPLSGPHNMVFKIFDVPTGGAPKWQEPQTGVLVIISTNGVFAVQLGASNALTPLRFMKVVGFRRSTRSLPIWA